MKKVKLTKNINPQIFIIHLLTFQRKTKKKSNALRLKDEAQAQFSQHFLRIKRQSSIFLLERMTSVKLFACALRAKDMITRRGAGKNSVFGYLGITFLCPPYWTRYSEFSKSNCRFVSSGPKTLKTTIFFTLYDRLR